MHPARGRARPRYVWRGAHGARSGGRRTDGGHRRRRPGSVRTGSRPGGARPAHPRRNPFALLYLALLLGTTLFAHLADPQLVRRLQALSSTDVHNLAHHPVLALVTSGCWVAGPLWTPYLWAVAVTVAPLERRVGGRRAAGVLAAGHVGATLLSQGVVLAAVALGAQGDDLLDALDIGVSYGVLASLGALAGLLAPAAGRSPWRSPPPWSATSSSRTRTWSPASATRWHC
ncbi:rhomboid-like protein [Kitasatospora paranensis]|uniref:rhomboid-like protein n=1 Tax=Kitasatospora paranensis TaxID=258053 RepID=UPI0031E88362